MAKKTQKAKTAKTRKGRGLSFQALILTLERYWIAQGCARVQPYDMEIGAGTFHPATALRALGKEPWRAVYVQPSRRPADGRYGQNPNRLQHYYQLQVILKPAPANIQALYMASLAAIGLEAEEHDIRFLEDDWAGPTLGAKGLGWEVRCDGLEVSQFTYFQQLCGRECDPVSGEITYGLERLAMYVQGVANVYDLVFSEDPPLSYGDLYRRGEREFSHYNFSVANIEKLLSHFADAEREAEALLERRLALPAYDQCLKASHFFNLLDARGAVGASARPDYIKRVRHLAMRCADIWLAK